MNQQSLNNFNIDSTIQYAEETQLTKVASQTSPPKGFQPQNHVIATEQPPGYQTWNEPVPFLSCSSSCPTDIPESEKHTKITFTGDTTIPPLTITTPLFEEKLVRDEQTNGLYLPFSSTVVLKRNQEMLYMPLDSKENLRVDAMVEESGALSVQLPRIS